MAIHKDKLLKVCDSYDALRVRLTGIEKGRQEEDKFIVAHGGVHKMSVKVDGLDGDANLGWQAIQHVADVHTVQTTAANSQRAAPGGQTSSRIRRGSVGAQALARSNTSDISCDAGSLMKHGLITTTVEEEEEVFADPDDFLEEGDLDEAPAPTSAKGNNKLFGMLEA